MGLSEKLVQIESERSALLQYLNEKSGDSDTSLSEAVKKIVDGMGSGGASNVVCGEYTFESLSVPSSGRIIELPFDGTPSMVLMYIDSETFDAIPEDDKVNNMFYCICIFSERLDFPPHYYGVKDPKAEIKAMVSTTVNPSTEEKAVVGFNNKITDPKYAQYWGIGDGCINVGRFSSAAVSFFPVTYKWIAIYTDATPIPQGANVVEGTFTIPEDTTSGVGFELPVDIPFDPNYIRVWMDRNTFLGLDTQPNNCLYSCTATKIPDTVPPLIASTSVCIQEKRVDKNGYLHYIALNVQNNPDTTSQYTQGISSAVGSLVDPNARKGWLVDNRKYSIGSISTGSVTIKAGTYHYIAIGGVDIYAI